MKSDAAGQKFMRAWQRKNALFLIPIAALAVALPVGAGLLAQSLGAPSNLVSPIVILIATLIATSGLQLNRGRANRELHAEVARTEK
jgi:peptidoglycan/LPS O-acetylase OafA/YrhL